MIQHTKPERSLRQWGLLTVLLAYGASNDDGWLVVNESDQERIYADPRQTESKLWVKAIIRSAGRQVTLHTAYKESVLQFFAERVPSLFVATKHDAAAARAL